MSERPAVDTGLPPVPVQFDLDESEPRTALRGRLQNVLVGLPSYFEFNNHVAGVNATDLHSLNTLLGTSIENQVVKALNLQRKIWDPDDEWRGYTFERQSQVFPDVRLSRKHAGGYDVALGIELKGWFLLAKEGEPSFRFTTTPAACDPRDLLVVVPWFLDHVMSGSPVAAEPFVAGAKWAAEYRNYYWQHLRQADASADRNIRHPTGASPYPGRDQHIVDVPAYDGGGNFGRVARVRGLMDDFVAQANDSEVLGIRIGDWHSFLKRHSDRADPDEVSDRLRAELKRHVSKRSEADAAAVAAAVRIIGDLLNQ